MVVFTPQPLARVSSLSLSSVFSLIFLAFPFLLLFLACLYVSLFPLMFLQFSLFSLHALASPSFTNRFFGRIPFLSLFIPIIHFRFWHSSSPLSFSSHLPHTTSCCPWRLCCALLLSLDFSVRELYCASCVCVFSVFLIFLYCYFLFYLDAVSMPSRFLFCLDFFLDFDSLLIFAFFFYYVYLYTCPFSLFFL